MLFGVIVYTHTHIDTSVLYTCMYVNVFAKCSYPIKFIISDMMFIYVEIFSSALVFHQAFDLGSFSLCSIVPIYFIAVATTFQFFGS